MSESDSSASSSSESSSESSDCEEDNEQGQEKAKGIFPEDHLPMEEGEDSAYLGWEKVGCRVTHTTFLLNREKVLFAVHFAMINWQ